MKTKLTSSLLFALVGLTLLINACAPAPTATSNTKLKVLTTTSFLADIAQNIAGNRLQIESLLPAGVDPHEYQPTPKDAIKIEEANVLIVNGLGYETWLQKLLDSAQTKPTVIIATQGLTPNPDPSGEHKDGDPHMWMNPLNGAHYAENIRDGLIQVDPDGRDLYATHTDGYISKLYALDLWIQNQVKQIPADKRLLVTNHDALGYFAQAYGFTIIGTVLPGLSSEAAPTGTQLADLIDKVKSAHAPAIFLNISENPKLADQIAEETKTKVVTGLYIETLSKADGPAPTYIDMLKYNVGLITSALK